MEFIKQRIMVVTKNHEVRRKDAIAQRMQTFSFHTSASGDPVFPTTVAEDIVLFPWLVADFNLFVKKLFSCKCVD